MQTQTDTITKTDLDRIEASIRQVIEVAKTQKSHAEMDDMIKTMTKTIADIKMTVEFDHEKRLNAIENFLQNL
jgi:uncharacterized FlaG/YvyC family protein